MRSFIFVDFLKKVFRLELRSHWNKIPKNAVNEWLFVFDWLSSKMLHISLKFLHPKQFTLSPSVSIALLFVCFVASIFRINRKTLEPAHNRIKFLTIQITPIILSMTLGPYFVADTSAFVCVYQKCCWFFFAFKFHLTDMEEWDIFSETVCL